MTPSSRRETCSQSGYLAQSSQIKAASAQVMTVIDTERAGHLEIMHHPEINKKQTSTDNILL